jgi:hypothetical protein
MSNQNSKLRRYPRTFAFLFSLLSFAITLSVIEAFFAQLNRWWPSPYRYTGTQTNDFMIPDPHLGSRPRASTKVTAQRFFHDQIIYDVTYTTDAFHRRWTPVDSLKSRKHYLLHFGDSYMFGHGLNNKETLPHYMGKLSPQFTPYNYAYCGYGPHHFVAALERPLIRSEIPEETGALVYLYLDLLVERAIPTMMEYFNWGPDAPYYALNERGQVERKGPMPLEEPTRTAIYKWLWKSEVLKFLVLDYPFFFSDGHYELMAKIFAKAKQVYEEKFQNDNFYIVLYPGSKSGKRIIPLLEKLNVKYLDYSNLFNPEEGYRLGLGDLHPNARANQILAEKLSADLGLSQKSVLFPEEHGNRGHSPSTNKFTQTAGEVPQTRF